MNDYLWERSGPVDPAVAALERRLGQLAFDAARHPLPANILRPARPARRIAVIRRALIGIAAVALVATGLAAFHAWRLDWPVGQAWRVNGGAALLRVGGSLRFSAPAVVDIARLGELRAAPGTALSLVSTGPARHRLKLAAGTIDVRVWAPPGRLGVATPAGNVIDFGCVFRLSVDNIGAAHLSVATGWVGLENPYGKTYVPAGASASLYADRPPEVPVYDDAASALRDAVRAIDAAPEALASADLQTVIGLARVRDVLTLLTLSSRDALPRPARTALLERAAILLPPPEPGAVARVVDGDRDIYWKWYDSQPLPSLKAWWRNWRDVFPR